MKKNAIYLLTACFLLYSSPAWSFILPPFKIDPGAIAKEIATYVQTTSQNVSKAIQDNVIIQTALTYGKGAKEAADFAQATKKDYKGADFNKLGAIQDDLKKAQTQKTKTEEEAAKEIAIKSEETNKKIAEIDKNQIELRKKVLEDPDNAKKYQKELEKNEKEKTKLANQLSKDVKKINEKSAKDLASVDKQMDGLKQKASALLPSITEISGSYDSSEDLKQTAEALMPSPDTKITVDVANKYKERYQQMSYEDANKTMYRAGSLKEGFKKDNEKAKESLKSVGTMEGATSAVTITAKMKVENSQALINLTELLLLKLQNEIAADLARHNFVAVNPVQSVAEFNFDNYRFVMSEDGSYEPKDLPREIGQGEALDEGVLEPSEAVMAGAVGNMGIDAPEGDTETPEGKE